MRRLFFRIYVALCAVCIAGFVAAGAWDQARRRPPTLSVIQSLNAAPDTVREALSTHGERDARRILRETSKLEINLVPLNDNLPSDVREPLLSGRDVLPATGRPLDAWVAVPEFGLAAHVWPRRQGRPPPIPWIVGGVLVGLGVTIALLLFPLERDLGALAEAAQRFGSGEHDVRADVRPNGATAHLADRFNEMATEIGSLVQGQRDLLLAVSHELRTPLHRLRFATELLADEPDAQARRTQSEALQGDLDELDRLVGDLLTWGRLGQAPPVHQAQVALAPLCAGLLDDAVRLRPELDTECRIPDALTVQGSDADLRRALSNLVANATRHARHRICVSAERTSTHVRVLVDDDGPGIPAADRERVLEPFVRLDEARTRDAGGAGLGLALAQRVAESHRGTLSIEDSPLGGARMVLALA